MLGIDPVELPEVQGEYAYKLLKQLKEVKMLDDNEEKFFNYLKKRYEKVEDDKEQSDSQDSEND